MASPAPRPKAPNQATGPAPASHGRPPPRFPVPRPATIGLRGDDAAREPALVFGQRPDEGAEHVAEAKLFLVVVTQPAAAVQVQHERYFAGRLRSEHPVRHRPRTVMRALLEARLEAVGA